MADIELVIKIPKAYYELVLERCKDPVLLNAFKNGTPLPKGHGDLIDRKDLIENGIHKGFCDWYDEIKKADAIIEADKG